MVCMWPGSLSVLPVQCLCEFLLNDSLKTSSSSQEGDKTGKEPEIVKRTGRKAGTAEKKTIFKCSVSLVHFSFHLPCLMISFDGVHLHTRGEKSSFPPPWKSSKKSCLKNKNQLLRKIELSHKTTNHCLFPLFYLQHLTSTVSFNWDKRNHPKQSLKSNSE